MGITPELHSVEVIFRKPWLISEGSIPASTNITVEDFELNRETHLDIIEQLCEEYGYEWRVNDDFTFDLMEKFGTVHELPFISGENCTFSALSDKMEVINVVECLGMGLNDINDGNWTIQQMTNYLTLPNKATEKNLLKHLGEEAEKTIAIRGIKQ